MDIDFYFWRFPLNLIAGGLFLLLMGGVFLFFRTTRIFRCFSNLKTTLFLIAFLTFELLADGFLGSHLYVTWWFAIPVLILLFQLGLVLLRRLSISKFNWHDILFFLNHAGIFLVIWTIFFVAPDRQRLKMIVSRDSSNYEAYSSDGEVFVLPFSVRLDSFEIDVNPQTKTPNQFRSHLLFKKGDFYLHQAVEVNKPAFFDGYRIYQDGYDEQKGSLSEYSILQLVYDPCFGLVYVGFGLLFLGAIGMLFFEKR